MSTSKVININSKEYNGYPSWDAWNVSLWINNDESLYNRALYHLKHSTNPFIATTKLMKELKENGVTQTPDGARFEFFKVLHAIEDIEV